MSLVIKDAPSTIVAPPIVNTLLVPTSPIVAEKDKSIHSQHGVIHYPF